MSRGGRRAQRRKVTYRAAGTSAAGRAQRPRRERIPGLKLTDGNRLQRLAFSLGAETQLTGRGPVNHDHDADQGGSDTRG